MWAGTEKRAPLGGRTKKLDLKEADDVKQELPTRNSEDPYRSAKPVDREYPVFSLFHLY